MTDPIDGVFNLRDLGEVAGTAGAVYRADGIHRTTPEGRAQLVATTRVRQVIDLRSKRELESEGRFEHPDVVHHHVPIVQDPRFFGEVDEGDVGDVMRAHYGRMLADNGKAYAAALTLIATALEANEPVLFHCTAGKDRTGTLAALILASMGLDDEVIATDYARSADAMPHMIEWYRLNGKPTPPERMKDMGMDESLAAQMFRADAPSMHATLADLRTQHGSIESYLTSINATSAVDTITGQLRSQT